MCYALKNKESISHTSTTLPLSNSGFIKFDLLEKHWLSAALYSRYRRKTSSNIPYPQNT